MLQIKQLPKQERPRERLLRLGPGALSEAELLACLFGSGSSGESVLVLAQRLLAGAGSLRGLAQRSPQKLQSSPGLGPAKATALAAAIEIGRRIETSESPDRVWVNNEQHAASLLKAYFRDMDREHFVALLLDTRHRLIRLFPVAVGSLSAALVHPRELFKGAIEASAAAVILAHNHPSGDPEPSQADLELTRRLVRSGTLLGIEVLDHLIFGSNCFISLRAEGHTVFGAPESTRS